jgi:hypothetical protein
MTKSILKEVIHDKRMKPFSEINSNYAVSIRDFMAFLTIQEPEKGQDLPCTLV